MENVQNKIIFDWIDFSTDTETYSREAFENAVGDQFEAMMFDDNHEIPSFIWTLNYVCVLQNSARMINDISIKKVPRNPACK
ncbi:hypothetical protein [Texcoconibacillus texcoconensis]|uniref:Uncharacterized protein n=1 Tax=Texcoconibacillus texcoconensis TaxID=1095777 RepID=A0A840QT26_9BACI|nr:hypothetical protein [Texcoconibacillus texcoconensis]MBB5174682.1 hypothetical protein [Texcoconibacillus texcoconensis]